MGKNEVLSTANVAEKIYRNRPIHPRAAALLALQIGCTDYALLVEPFLNRERRYFNTDALRGSIIADIDERRSSVNATSDVLAQLEGLWALGPFLARDCIIHSFTGKKRKLLADAHVAYALSSLGLAVCGRSKDELYQRTIYKHKDHLQALARKVVESRDWSCLVKVARTYFKTPLAQAMYDVTRIWSRETYSPTSNHGPATDAMIVSVALITRPDETMGAARRVFHEVFEGKK